MEPMDIDHIVEVPDTPDRLTTRNNDGKYNGNPEKRERRLPVGAEMNNRNNYIILSPSERSQPSENAPIFRRAQSEKIFGHGLTHSNEAEKIDKGKTVSITFPAKSSNHGPASVLDLTEENRQSQKLRPAFSHRGSRDNATADKRELKANNGNTSLGFINGSSNTLRNKPLPGPKISMDHGKSIALSDDSQPQLNTEKQVSLPHHLSTTPRCSRGQKRLVRNGCISPHNIAAMAKQPAPQSSHQSNDVEQTHAGQLVTSSTVSPIINVDDIVAEQRVNGRVKGKQVLTHPPSHGVHAGSIHTTISSPVIDYEEANVTSNAVRNSLKYSGEQGGWRTTHNDKNSNQHLLNGHKLRRNNDDGRFITRQNSNRILDKRDTGSSQSRKDVQGQASQATSLTIPEVVQSSGSHLTAGTLTRRQRKRGSTIETPNEASFNSEIVFLSPSGESSHSSPSPNLDREVIELLSTPRGTSRLSEGLDDIDKNNSDARARQVEADEILARELQEQLYHDDHFEGNGIDEHLAWELQHGEDFLHSSIDSRHISHPTWRPRTNRQPRSRSNQNPSNRRRAAPQVPLSNRMLQLRNRIVNRPTGAQPIMASRRRRPWFPLDMDIDMRLDILEQLEDALGDLSDVGVANDFFHTQRDFNEDDYEMLLALDERNHNHTGASSNQINSLPQSTVQTDNITEACAICLEIPGKGETIRHLPCLHKFHKDCIDPWLHRKTTCPVCKSSIT